MRGMVSIRTCIGITITLTHIEQVYCPHMTTEDLKMRLRVVQGEAIEAGARREASRDTSLSECPSWWCIQRMPRVVGAVVKDCLRPLAGADVALAARRRGIDMSGGRSPPAS